MDLLDKKILAHLDLSARTPITKLAQSIQSSPQRVKYHYEKLVDEGVVTAFIPLVEVRALGYLNGLYFFRLKNMTTSARGELSRFLKEHNQIIQVLWGDGFWDLCVTISEKGIFRNQTIFEELFEKFYDFIISYKPVSSVGVFRFFRKYLHDEGYKKSSLFTEGDKKTAALSTVQVRILEELNRSARISYNELANQLCISRQSVVRNIVSLEKNKIICGYTVVLDHSKISMLYYRVLLLIKNFNHSRHQEFFSYCQDCLFITAFTKVVGNWQVMVDIEIPSVTDMRALMTVLKTQFSDIIYYTEATQVYQVDKWRDLPLKLN